MKKNIFDLEGIVSTTLDGKVIHVKWTVLSNAQAIYDSCNAQIEAVQKQGAEIVLIDMLDAKGTPPMECQKWFGDVLFPAFSKNKNFKGLVNILPSSTITKMGANHWKKTASSSDLGIDVYETHSLEKAMQLAADLGV